MKPRRRNLQPPVAGSDFERVEYIRRRKAEGVTMARIAAELRITERRAYQLQAAAAELERLAS